MNIATGDHRVRITGEVGMGRRDDGKEFVAVEVELIEAQQRLTYFGNFGDEVTWSDPKTGKSMTPTDFTMASLRAGGWKGDDISDLSSMAGSECMAVVDYDKNGNARIKKLKGNGGGVQLKTQLSPAELKAFAATMRQKIAAANAKNGVSTVPAAKPASTDDAPPF